MSVYVVGLAGKWAMIDDYQSLIWTTQYYGPGDFELIAPATEHNKLLLTAGQMLAREEDIGTQIRNVMVIESVTIRHDINSGDLITVRGCGLGRSILRRRVVWNQITMTDRVETIIRRVVYDNLISEDQGLRMIPDFRLGPEIGGTVYDSQQLRGENVADFVEQECRMVALGWEVWIEGGEYVFGLLKGTDHSYGSSSPVIFSPEYDNLLTAEYSKSTEIYANVALVGGEGEGLDQRMATVGYASGLNRYEMYVDGSGVSSNGEIITESEYEMLLQDYGGLQLSDVKHTETISGTVDYERPFRLGVDYKLGDLVQIDADGIAGTARVTEVIYSEAPDGITVIPKFEEWEVN